MRVHNKIGTKERLIEMFEKVNKVKVNESQMWGEKITNESFDSPKEKDEKYLDKTVGDESSQVSKYDDGTRYPVEDKLKVKDPSLEKLKGDDAPIEECEGCDDENMKSQNGSFETGAEVGETFQEFSEDEDDQDIANDDEPVNIGDTEPEENDGEEGFEADDTDSDDIAMDMGFEDQMEGGLADDAMPSDFDPEQIVKGIKIEMEHTSDPKKALEIAMDHLSEIPDYYDRLASMEAEAKGESGMDNEEGSPEEALLDPSKHWIDDYSPQNVTDEGINYPTPFTDPEAGEDEYEEMRKLKNGDYDGKTESIKSFLESNDAFDEAMDIREKDNTVTIFTGYGNGQQKRLSPEIMSQLEQNFGKVSEDFYEDDDRGIRWEYSIETN